MGTLIDVLKTPSSDVQRAVADCLGPLMAGLADDHAYAEQIVRSVLELLTKKGSTYGERWEEPYLLQDVYALKECR
jgi:hypothetical protein